jgi:hypothetical protein
MTRTLQKRPPKGQGRGGGFLASATFRPPPAMPKKWPFHGETVLNQNLPASPSRRSREGKKVKKIFCPSAAADNPGEK